MTEFFKLLNGVQLESRQEVKAYIRGLELMRDNLNLSPSDQATVAAWLDDANSAKNLGALSAEAHSKREQKQGEAAKSKPAKSKIAATKAAD